MARGSGGNGSGNSSGGSNSNDISDNWVPLEPPCGMSAGQKAIIEEENKYREMFYSDRGNKVLDDPHLNLINPFDPEVGKTFVFEEEVTAHYQHNSCLS